ncbi:hypothetical protein GGS20DRAFT_567331 [Poronia punctata]|nr:hypothetical protein GGS20DRAFT_567331 [Poronia punctata]
MTSTASAQSAPKHDSAKLDSSPRTASDTANNTTTHIQQDVKHDDTPHTKPRVNGEGEPYETENGNTDGDDDERPSKRRRVRDTTPTKPIRKSKPVSPPWKKIEAEGPTTFIDNGRRRSGRTNALPLDLQPQSNKRMTRGVLHGLQDSPISKDNHVSGSPRINGPQRQASTPRAPPSKPKVSTPNTKPSSKKLSSAAPKSPPKTRTGPAPSKSTAVSPKRSLGTRRSSRTRRDDPNTPTHPTELEQSPNSRPTRIRFRIKPQHEPTVPIVHPAQVQVPPGQTLPRPRIAASFEEYTLRAPKVNIHEGGWFDSTDDGPPYTQEMAEKDAQIILRVEKEVEPGGLLSEGRSALFAPDPVEEPPRQWAHMDHLVKQMAHFRKLMVMEHQRHKATAKRLADACRDDWLRRQPKTAEEIEAEARNECIMRYRTVVRALAATWENVKAEVNRRRVEEWEAAEQKRVKAALNEAVSMSELKLQARQARIDSEALSDEDLDDSDQDISDLEDDNMGDDIDVDSVGSTSEDESSNDEDNMSSSSDDDDLKSTISDEGLTQEQLRKKYANIPELPTPDTPDDNATPKVVDGRSATSDESVDMDDDITSGDDSMDSGNGENSGAEDEESDDEGGSGGLLGLFFGKNELKKLKENDGVVDEEAASGEEKSELEASIGLEIDIPDREPETDVSTKPVHIPTNPGAEPPMGPSYYDGDSKPSMIAVSVTDTECVSGRGTGSALASPTKQPADGGPDAPPAVDPAQEDIEMGETDSIKGAGVDDTQAPDSNAHAQAPDLISSVEVVEASPEPRKLEGDTVLSSMKPAIGESASPSQGPQTEVPFLLRGTLREYQHYGLDWLAGLYKNQTNGILADEMGLGKTIQTIALLAHLACDHEVWGPHLVIVPTSVMLNWEMEFKKWCPGFKVLSYYGSIEERKRKRQGWKTDDMWNVCITSYQIVLQDQQVFKRRQWHYMILDEAHNIKNFKSKRWQTLLGFNTRARLLLTGTPLQNNLTELWSLLFFLMPSENGVGGFADLAEFQDWFHKPESQILESGREQMDDEARAIIAKLHKVLRPYLLRRLKADVEKQMPAKFEHVELCRLSRRQRELYDGFLARADTREALASGNYISVINCLMQLRKVCNHPDLFVERPIMTSFRQPRSVPSEFESTEALVRRRFLTTDSMTTGSLSFLNLMPTQHEHLSAATCDRVFELGSGHDLLELLQVQEARARTSETALDPSTVESNLTYLDSAGRWSRLEELRQCVYVNNFRRQQHPIYGKQLTDFLTLGVDRRPFRPRPKIPQKIMSWFQEDSLTLRTMVPTVDQRAASMKATVSKFACVTPAVVTRDLDRFVLGSRGIEAFDDFNLELSTPVRYAPFAPKEAPIDPWHESRMKLSIQFPDKRLLQYDCGKLQVLDRLLRKLQAGGHRALIFTQMTKVLDVLERFLNIHGHKYLRLDGATKVEQRQILTDRFNNDPRILCFILSTRSGGLGINLTGADTVIFYDQDWNPAMDKQCQDRCHRIGQTRDVHIYRLVSEHTIEANILRKASQKQMLDDIVIQEGGFTTDYFSKLSVGDVINGVTEEADVVGDAMDRVLGGVETADQRTVGRVLEQAEDREDVAAAHVAEKEIQEDEADFAEKAPTASASGASTTRQNTPMGQGQEGSLANGVGRSNLGLFAESMGAEADSTVIEVEHNAWGEQMHTIDDHMLRVMSKQLEGTALELPKDKKKSKNKKGKDTRKR